MPQPFLELKGIGKIYVSEGNVAVGIRGVNLSFSRGEFVAITGTSGSGKSTLLNVISGMDSYEEGELFIQGEPTSHYMQKDWEAYREKYISFIFQEYNIIESFTVLQNVELALMSIQDPKVRREKAMELIRRVGLEKFIRHKGSKLSGGQKQRTVIARALAKDSPVILADEPTGNLDSQTSAEIIELLREVSKDKLVIVVTHNFEQVEAYATRHIRVFDGAVESDHAISAPPPTAGTASTTAPTAPAPAVKHRRGTTLRNAAMLGRVRFTATPKLSVFLCVLMTVVALLMTAMTSISADAKGLFDKNHMFHYMNGRVIIARTDGGVMSDEELAQLAAKVGATRYLHYDYMLDKTTPLSMIVPEKNFFEFTECNFSYPAESLSLDAGRYPETDSELILRVPLTYEQVFGRGDSFKPYLLEDVFDMADYTVTGVSYYIDNTITPTMYFTESGYRTATALAFFNTYRHNFHADAYVLRKGATRDQEQDILSGLRMEGYDFLVDFQMEPGTYAVSSLTGERLTQMLSSLHMSQEDVDFDMDITGAFTNYYYEWVYREDAEVWSSDTSVSHYGAEEKVQLSLKEYRMVHELKQQVLDHLERKYMGDMGDVLIMAPDVFEDLIVRQHFEKAYTQASLFFSDDGEAHHMIETLRDMGYTAIASDETVEEDVFNKLLRVVMTGMQAFGWLITIVFISMFLGLCSSKAMEATRGDIAIMRSMGIPTPVVKASIFFQTTIALIPAILITAVTCIVIYLTPKTNGMFQFLHAGDYILLLVILVAVAIQLSRRYIKKMFGESVKKTLKGGNKA